MFTRLRNAFRPRPVVVESRCPSCGERLDEHVQRDIASAVIGTEDEAQLCRLIEETQWSAATKYQAANAIADIRAWLVMRCKDGRVAVVSRVMPIEIWSDDYYEEPRFLSSEETADLLKVVSIDAG